MLQKRLNLKNTAIVSNDERWIQVVGLTRL